MYDYKSEAMKELARRELEKRQANSPENQLMQIQEKHPYLSKIAEYLQGFPGLETAGNVAGRFNNAVEGTGLPSAARGMFEPGIEAGRGIANLMPGVNIPHQELPELNVNPYLGSAMETAGALGSFGKPLSAAHQGIKKGFESIPKIGNKIPEAISSILSGAGLGSAISPENRGLGALAGGGLSSIPHLPQIAEEMALTKKIAARPLREARKLGIEREIGNLEMPKDIFKESMNYLPKNLQNKNLINKAKKGGYDELFTLQSDLGKAGTTLRKSSSGADRLHGQAAEQLRQRIISEMKSSLEKKGHKDIADLMGRGQKLYRRNRKFTRPALTTALALTLGANPLKKGASYLKEFL